MVSVPPILHGPIFGIPRQMPVKPNLPVLPVHPVSDCTKVHVDHAGELGYAYDRMYLFTGDKKYLRAATNVADVLAKYVRKGSATQSVWPYRVIMSTGEVTSEYGANWTGCYMLLDNLVKDGLGDVKAYERARGMAKDYLLEFPLKTGYWTDGHTDTDVDSHTYKSNLSASNFKLGIYDYPELSELENQYPEINRMDRG